MRSLHMCMMVMWNRNVMVGHFQVCLNRKIYSVDDSVNTEGDAALTYNSNKRRKLSSDLKLCWLDLTCLLI